MIEGIERTIDTIHRMIRHEFPEAVTVTVFINCEGITVTPVFKTNADGYSMKNIDGKWIKRENK